MAFNPTNPFGLTVNITKGSLERLLEERREQTGRYFTEEKEQQLRTLTAVRSDSAA